MSDLTAQPAPPRVLILSASIGEGHDLPARLLADALQDRAAADVQDGLHAMGPVVEGVILGSANLDTRRGRAGFEVSHWLVARTRAGGRLGSWLLQRTGTRGLMDLIDRSRPDVIVSTYPGCTELLGRLRARGVLSVPTVSAITDLASLRFWAHPGIDVHLITHPESAPEVRDLTGPKTRIEAVRGLFYDRFLAPPDRQAARTQLGLDSDGGVVVVSGGGWAVGDLQGAARAAAELPEVGTVIVLCGRRDDLRAGLDRALSDVAKVRTWGFTDEMATLLAAASALVHSTAGLTVLEAQLQGCPVISYGWGAGHIRANNAAFQRLGLARVARDPEALRHALRAAVAERPQPTWAKHAALPAAADVILGLVR